MTGALVLCWWDPNGTTSTENSLERLQNVKHKIINDPAMPPLGMYPKGLQMDSNRELHPGVHCSIIHARQEEGNH